MADESKPSAVETFKLESNYLRGTIAEELAGEADSFGKASVQLLKHHGTYQQDDRDARGRPAVSKGTRERRPRPIRSWSAPGCPAAS